MFKVTYTHLRGYRVSRTFPTREAAQEFIDINVMIGGTRPNYVLTEV